MSQGEFWGAIGVAQSTGCKYEGGFPIPDTVRRLLAVHYLADIPTNAPAGDLLRLGVLARSGSQAERSLRRAEALIEVAHTKICSAIDVIRGAK